jgi:hypothetical protein
MTQILKFPFQLTPSGVAMPYIPVQLESNAKAVQVMALLDTGAMVNAMPHRVGKALGLDWELGDPSELGGNIGKAPSKVFTVFATIASLKPIQLEINWSQSDDLPVIFGQIDFFTQFDACFSYLQNELSLRVNQ